MASKLLAYHKDDNSYVAIAIDDALYVALSGAGNPWADIADQTYDTLAFMQNDHAGVQMAPNGFEPRTITVKHLFGSAVLICPEPFDNSGLQAVEDPTLCDGNALDIKQIKGEVDNSPNITFS